MEYLTAPEIARLFGVSSETVRRLIDSGELESIRLSEDGWRRVAKPAVIEYAESKRIKLDWTLVEK